MATRPIPLWRNFPVADRKQSLNFVLFYTCQREEGGLKLQITDLVYIWSAVKTSKEELKAEAVRTRCSIDPTEDDEQYEVLVHKLEEAVSGRNGASVEIVRDKNSSTPNPARFEIETLMPLPSPLGTLEWTFRMVRQEPSILTQELVIPALHVIDASRRREEDLRRRIKEKDHVIGKLMDKTEGSGIDLAMVFPGFAGARKGLNAIQAANVVPGVAAFRVEDWGGDLKDGDDSGFKEIIDTLRDPETGKVVRKGPRDSVRQFDCDQHGDSEHSVAQVTKRNQQILVPSSAAHVENYVSSDAPRRHPKVLRQSSSSSSSPAPIRSRESSSKPRASELGAFEWMKSKPVAVPRQDSSSPSPERPAKASSISSSASTETESGSEPDRAPPVLSPQKLSPKKPRSKMGIIGGRKPQISTKEKTKSPEPSPSTSQSAPSRGKLKLGAIGGKKARTVSPPRHDSDSTASATPSPQPGGKIQQVSTDSDGTQRRPTTPSKSEEPMTEAERANRKRLELKRQLDEGARRRKKRKF